MVCRIILNFWSFFTTLVKYTTTPNLWGFILIFIWISLKKETIYRDQVNKRNKPVYQVCHKRANNSNYGHESILKNFSTGITHFKLFLALWCGFMYTKICLRYNTGTHNLVVTYSCLIWPIQLQGNHDWYWKPSQLPGASETMRSLLPQLF